MDPWQEKILALFQAKKGVEALVPPAVTPSLGSPNPAVRNVFLANTLLANAMEQMQNALASVRQDQAHRKMFAPPQPVSSFSAKAGVSPLPPVSQSAATSAGRQTLPSVPAPGTGGGFGFKPLPEVPFPSPAAIPARSSTGPGPLAAPVPRYLPRHLFLAGSEQPGQPTPEAIFPGGQSAPPPVPYRPMFGSQRRETMPIPLPVPTIRPGLTQPPVGPTGAAAAPATFPQPLTPAPRMAWSLPEATPVVRPGSPGPSPGSVPTVQVQVPLPVPSTPQLQPQPRMPPFIPGAVPVVRPPVPVEPVRQMQPRPVPQPIPSGLARSFPWLVPQMPGQAAQLLPVIPPPPQPRGPTDLSNYGGIGRRGGPLYNWSQKLSRPILAMGLPNAPSPSADSATRPPIPGPDFWPPTPPPVGTGRRSRGPIPHGFGMGMQAMDGFGGGLGSGSEKLLKAIEQLVKVVEENTTALKANKGGKGRDPIDGEMNVMPLRKGF